MKITPEDLRNAWNVNCGEMSKCSTLEIKQRFKLAQLFIEKVNNLPRIVAAIKRAAASPYCTGHEALGSEMHLMSLDWFLRPETLALIEEGQYDRRGYREFEPPASTAPHREDYWGKIKPEIRITDEELWRAQVQGRLCRILERKAGRPSMTPETKHAAGITPETDDFSQDWIKNGGVHPWAKPDELREAENYVRNARLDQKNPLPSTYGKFKPEYRGAE